MDAVIAHVVRAHRGVLIQRTLHFQVPFNVGRVDGLVLRSVVRWRRKARVGCLQIRQRGTLRETIHERSVVAGGRGKYVARDGGGKRRSSGKAVHGEGVHVGSIEREALQHLLRQEIAEIANAAPNHRLAAAERRPGKSQARLESERRSRIKCLRDAGLNRLIVRDCRIMIGELEGLGEPRKGILPAGDVRLAIEAQRARQLQVRRQAPIVFDVETQIVRSERRMQRGGERLRVVDHSSVVEIGQVVGYGSGGVGAIEKYI